VEEIDRGLFGAANSEELFSDDSQTKNQPFTGQSYSTGQMNVPLHVPWFLHAADSIFEEDEKKVRQSAKISVLKEEEQDLFIPEGVKADGQSQGKENSYIDKVEDNSELLT
jgi:hypothetical protein